MNTIGEGTRRNKLEANGIAPMMTRAVIQSRAEILERGKLIWREQ